MPVPVPTPAAAPALTFCREYVELAGDLAGIAKAFLIAALVLGVAYALVETYKKYLEAPALNPRSVPGGSSIKELMEALKGFVEALAKAPAWLGLFAVGLLLYWVAGASLPGECKVAMNDVYGTTSPPVAGSPEGGRQKVDGNVSGGTGNVSAGTGNATATANTAS